MRFFALDTNVDKVRKRYCSAGECEVLLTRYHWLSFVFRSIRDLLVTAVLVVIGVFVWIEEWPLFEVFSILIVLWFVFVFFRVLKSFLDWRYDMLLVTTDKLILIDQTSFHSRDEKPIHLENIGGIKASTQFWDIFPFGKITVHLKEGLGGDSVTIAYIPDVENVAAVIMTEVTKYQRKKHELHANRGAV